MAYDIVFGFGMHDGSGNSVTFVGLGSDTIVLSGTGFKYDDDGYLKSGKITKMTYMEVGIDDPQQNVTLNVDAAKLYADLLQPALELRAMTGDWSETQDTVSVTSKKIVLETDDFGQVVVTGTNLAEDPTKGDVTALELLDENGHSVDKVSNLHVSLSTALTALGVSTDIYEYLTRGDNTITNTNFFPPRLEGGLGNDTLKGGDAVFAIAEYVHTATAGIKADLGAGKVTGGAGNDKLVDIVGVSGSNFNDTLIGRNDAKQADSLFGNGGKDKIDGLAGDDRLQGDAGNDKLAGGAGDDRIDGGAGNDVLDGAGGTKDIVAFDSAQLDPKGITIHLDKSGMQDFGGWGKDSLKGFEGVYGSAVDDHIFGSKADNILVGSGGDDQIKGMDGNDTLYGDIGPGGGQNGFDGDDTMDGGAGNDTINNSAGADTLIGGTGKDTFVFNTVPSPFNGDEPDKIKDFNAKDDAMKLQHFSFFDLDVGKLGSDAFVNGTEAKDAEDRIIYDKSTGKLYFDEDGTGSEDQVLFATLVNKAQISNADFVVF